MKMDIKDIITTYKLNLEEITQLCGADIITKNFIIDSIDKYFGNKKYAEYDERFINNIEINGEEVGTKYFDKRIIRNRKDLIDEIKFTKSSLLNKYICNLICEYDAQVHLERINVELSRVFEEINESINKKIGNISLNYNLEDILSMVQKTNITYKGDDWIENAETSELIFYYLNLFDNVWEKEPSKSLIIFENIDHFIMRNEYKKIIDYSYVLCKKYDVRFIFTSCIYGFVSADEQYISGINVVNNKDVYQMDSIENMLKFFNGHYPTNYCIHSFRLKEIIEKIVHLIGDENYQIDLQTIIFLKLINASNCQKNIVKSTLNTIENSFLLS